MLEAGTEGRVLDSGMLKKEVEAMQQILAIYKTELKARHQPRLCLWKKLMTSCKNSQTNLKHHPVGPRHFVMIRKLLKKKKTEKCNLAAF